MERDTFKRRPGALIACIATVALLAVTGCGSDGGSSTAAEAPAGATSTPGAASSEPETTSVTFNVGFKGIQYADLYTAIDQGFFEEEGIDVKLSTSTQPTGTVLMSGAAQISSGQPAATYVPNAEGADLVAVYSPASTFEAWVTKDSSITSPADLKGKKIGVFNLQDLDVIYTNQMMKQAGIGPDEYTLVAVGATDAKLAATSAGKVDAAPLYAPSNFAAQDQGMSTVFETTELDFGQIPTYYEVRRSWAEENPNTLVAMLRALNKAHAWLFDPANKDEAIRIMTEQTGVSKKLAEQGYDLYFSEPGKIYTETGEWDADVVKATAEQLVDLELLEPDNVPAYEDTVAPEYREQAAQEAG